MPLQITNSRQGICWTGAFFVHHSLALVNREMTLALLDNPTFTGRFDLSLQHYEQPTFAPETYPALVARMNTISDDLRVTVRHHWPPDFTRPASGQSVLMQPWEFGSLPRAWSENIAQSVDEVWAYSRFVKETYLRAGVPAEKVQIVPLGVNTRRFNPDVVPYDFSKNPKTAMLSPDAYKFLFVGGTISRKGIDVLLNAFDRGFNSRDEVVLIIKDFGTESFYANQGATPLIQALQVKPGGAKIIYLTENMSEEEIASLYAACDCLVHPYRGEGYGLPIAEAMACGKPTVLTNYGAALDFADATNAYLIPATLQYLSEKRIGDLPTVDHPFMAEPNREALTATLRHIVANREEAALKGAVAAEHIAQKHTWTQAAQIASERLALLAERAPLASTTFALPMGLGNVGLGNAFSLNSGLATSNTPLPGNTPANVGISLNLSVLGGGYEDRKQAALTETRRGNWQEAVTGLETCLLERPDDWDIVNALAVALFRTGETERAIDMLQKGTKVAPNARDFHHNLAFILLATDRAGEALENALAALSLTPDNNDIRRTVERTRDATLQQGRRILRSYPDSQRAQAKRDPAYVALMDKYRQAEEALKQGNAYAEKSPVARPRLSLCMIVKNEERFLRNCLESAKDIVDEIVIVDTGSTDSTLTIAREYGAIIVEHPWNDDFSEARNVSLDHATGDWALWLDADEEIAPESLEKFRKVIDTAPPEVGGYMVMFRNWLSSITRKPDSEMAVHHAVRLFRRLPGVRFEGRIHEQNLRSLQSLGFRHAKVDGLILDHFGYAGEVMTLRNKHERFIRMLKREVEECPAEEFRVFHLFNLGNAYFTAGDMENAARYLGMAAENPDPGEEFTVSMFMELATALHRLGRSKEGLDYCEKADKLGLKQAGIEFARGYCMLHMQWYTMAEKAFKEALYLGKTDTSIHAKTGDAGVTTFKSQYGLALAYVGQDRYEEALPVCEEALAIQPGFTDVRYLLSIVLRHLERDEEAVRTLNIVLEQSPAHAEAAEDLGLLYIKQENYAAALPFMREATQRSFTDREALARLAVCCEHLNLLEEAREVYERLRMLTPNSAEICVNLGRVLAANGADAEAINCFADAIEINPNYGNAYFNAGDLLYKMGYYARAAEVYITGLEREPEHPAGFFVLGNCYVQTEDYAAAVMSYEQALARNPHHTEAQHNLELAQERMQEITQHAA